MGPLDDLVGMQYRIDHLENAKADAFDLMIQPPLKIVGDVEEFAWGPSAEIYCGEGGDVVELRSEEHTSELQSLMRISYAVFCLKKKKKIIEYIILLNQINHQ